MTKRGWLCGATLASLAVAAIAQSPAGPVVAVTGGQVQGRPLPAPGGAVFKGIPYAAPPVGPFRWRETQPVKPWTGVAQAAEFRTGCGVAPDGADPKQTVAEDCLYLNVWAPEWPVKARRPVMFWVNGGELFGGSGALKAGAESLVRHGVVLVSANYRGTLLGMMGHAELSAETPRKSSANYMLYDELAVLRWIQANIAKFGGDPANVTIFGQSGGGHVISMLLAAPQAKGMIHRAIIDSGAPMQANRPYLTLKELETIGTVTGEVLSAPKTGTITWLRSRPAAEVVAAMPEVRQRLLEMDGLAYDEGTDGDVIPRSPADVWASHSELAVPMIIGSTAQDTASTIRGAAIPGPAATPEAVTAYKTEIVQLMYGHAPDLLAQARQIYGLTPGPNQVLADPTYGTSQQQLGTDFNHRCGSALSAAWHSKVAPSYLFEFSRISAKHPPTHSSELPYIFGTDELEDGAAREQSRIVQTYWTNFAKTGDPNGPGVPAWPKYEPSARRSLEFTNAGPVARADARTAACAPYEAKYTRDPKIMSVGKGAWIRGPAINPRIR